MAQDPKAPPPDAAVHSDAAPHGDVAPVSTAVIRGAGGVVVNPHGEVLVIRHRNGDWVFPKGHLDPGESPLQAAVREVEEEAGVNAHCADPNITRTTRYTNDRGEQRAITWFLLRCHTEKPVMREALFPEGVFLPPDEALQRLSFAEDRRLLTGLLPHLRQHSSQHSSQGDGS